jgi:ferredoxin
MNLQFITMSIAVVLAAGLVVTVVGLNFLTGSVEFFFGRPKLSFLKSRKGKNGFAFGLRWNTSKEPTTFDRIKIALYNPFAKPTQIEIIRSFSGNMSAFGEDLDLGPKFLELLDAISFPKKVSAKVMIELSSSKEGINHQFEMSSEKFLRVMNEADDTVESYLEKYGYKAEKVYYPTVKKSFVADPLPAEGGKKLKIAVNPEFAGAFAPAGAGEAAIAVENFSVSKVWIEPGCIVCDACETIIPEVFEVQDATCIIRQGAPLTDGLRILEAAEACPVEVIKFDR